MNEQFNFKILGSRDIDRKHYISHLNIPRFCERFSNIVLPYTNVLIDVREDVIIKDISFLATLLVARNNFYDGKPNISLKRNNRYIESYYNMIV